MATTLSGVIGLNALYLVALDSAHEAALAQILPQAPMARIALAWDLTPRQENVTMELVQVKKKIK